MSLGGDTEVDKGVADLLHEPLVHLLRNAVAHGIEPPERRRAAGKSAQGTVTLKAEREGSFVSVQVIDDGAGIAADAVRAAARAKAGEAAPLPDADVVDLLFTPGFSTAAAGGELAGRGVGLHAVATNVKRCGGDVTVDWEEGTGCCFRIRIPLTLAVIQALVVGVGRQRYALPTNYVEESVRIPARRVARINNTRAFIYRERPVPLLELAGLLGGDAERERDEYTAVVLGLGGRYVGLVVDRILLQQDALIRPLEAALGGLSHYAGATVLDDGSLILILDPPGLLAGPVRAGGAA